MTKIATILPYKENYSRKKAAAASLWVYEFRKYSKFKKNNYLFGSTNSTDYLSGKYININLNLKSKFISTTNQYCEKLAKKINAKKFDIVEIHNRPLVFNILHKKINSKFILYFHNDPLSMKGSKSIDERLRLLKLVDKIKNEANNSFIDIKISNKAIGTKDDAGYGVVEVLVGRV